MQPTISQELFDRCTTRGMIADYVIPDAIVIPKTVTNTTFLRCFLSGRIEGVCFSNCEFIDCNFGSIVFTNCLFDHCRFSRSSVTCSSFIDCRFQCGRIHLSNFSICDFSNVTTDSLVLHCSDFSNSTFTDCNMYTNAVRNCEFGRAKFERTHIDIGSHVPDTGSFTGWKKCVARYPDGAVEYYIVKLTIPEDALRTNAGADKCRASKAIVEDVQDLTGNSVDKIVQSIYDSTFTYEKGKTIEVDNFDENRFEECTFGIHFFLNRDNAVNFEM